MSQPWRQITGIVAAEFRLHWRRRGLVVISLSLLVLPAMGALFIRTQMAEFNRTIAATTGLSPEAAREPVTIAIVYGTWAAVYVVLAVLLPPVTADSIARDRQAGMRELLDSLPLTTGAYLAGKVLGALASVAAGLAFAMVAISVLWVVLVGGFNPGPYVQMWLVGALGMAVVNTSLGVLIAAGQPNRRRAVLVGVALSLVVLSQMTSDLADDPDSAGFLLSLARPALFNYYISGWLGQSLGSFGTATTLRHVGLTLLVGAGQAAVVGAAVWAWMRWREARL